ncbi:hypothetical protein V6N11_073392 [Hibiscus sabdariffa]|uniref:Uncharacterized protein n=2 Tax=Hibiscus sabdariffa TaxID=183260 RepID=A0ABR2P4R3_9ROSI
MEGESPEKEMDRGYKIGKDMTGLECLISEDVVKHDIEYNPSMDKAYVQSIKVKMTTTHTISSTISSTETTGQMVSKVAPSMKVGALSLPRLENIMARIKNQMFDQHFPGRRKEDGFVGPSKGNVKKTCV